ATPTSWWPLCCCSTSATTCSPSSCGGCDAGGRRRGRSAGGPPRTRSAAPSATATATAAAAAGAGRRALAGAPRCGRRGPGARAAAGTLPGTRRPRRDAAAGEIGDEHGRAGAATDPVGPGEKLWFRRELRHEAVPAAELTILHRDEHLLVIDKLHEIATMPRGAHVLASALVRLRRATGI